MNYKGALNRDKLASFQLFLKEMNMRALADHNGAPYRTDIDALKPEVMYFQPLMCAPSDRKEVAKWIIGSQEPGLQSVYNRACNIFATFFFGPSDIYHLLSGEPDPAKAFIDFERVAEDPAYVKEIADNIAYGKQHGFKLWTTTELHTSLQTEARNFCRIKYNEPERTPTTTDLIEWIASWIKGGQIDKIIEAKTLRGAYDAITSIRGVGSYYAGNPVMMLAALPEANCSHLEPFCAPGGGAIKSLEALFGKKFGFGPAVDAIAWLFDNQKELLPEIKVPKPFQNLDLHYGKLFKEDQTVYTLSLIHI